MSERDDARLWSRRQVLGTGGVLLATAALPFRVRAADGAFAPPAETVRALDASPLVYVSPLRTNGSESRCHGEVWFFYDKGDVVICTDTDRWKSEAIAKGMDRARLWVGDFGPVKRSDDRYRSAPTLLAKAEFDRDRATFDRLLAAFAKKYPDEWSRWKPRFEGGYADGSRVLIRYKALGA
jgi:hypothetical protein